MPSNNEVYCVGGIGEYGNHIELITFNLDEARKLFYELENDINQNYYNALFLVKTQLGKRILEDICNEECILFSRL